MIIGHVSPDLDCIGALWLLQRYGGCANEPIVLVSTGNPDPALLESARAVVDTGRVLDPTRLRFDHHQLPGAEANSCCATSLVFQWLKLLEAPEYLEWLAPLIDLIEAGDTGKGAAAQSRQVGIHALLSSTKHMYKPDDRKVLDFGFDMLDRIAAHLAAAHDARASLAGHVVYQSADGLLWALCDAPTAATFAAYEQGARLVVFAGYDKNAIGVWRGGESADVHCGELVLRVLGDSGAQQDVQAELRTWFRHNAGFYAGRGSDKAPSNAPITVDLVDVARALDRAWVR